MAPLWLAGISSAPAQGSFTVTGGASVYISGAACLKLNNTHWNNNGVFTAGSSVLDLTGNQVAGADIAGASPDVFHNLSVNRSAGDVSLGKSISMGGNLVFSAGLLDLSGYNITLNQPGGTLSGENENSRIFSSTTGEVQTTLDLNAPNQANPGNLGAVVSTAANLGTTLIRRGHQPPAGVCNTGIKRYYVIQPNNNTALNATLRFYYFDAELNGIVENDLTLYRSDDGGVTWTDAGFDARNAAENWVEKSGIASFSMWTLGATGAWLSEKTWYKDIDGDGFSDGVTQTACTQPVNYLAAPTGADCDDSNAAVYPGAAEPCNSLDDNCDGLIDEGCAIPFSGKIRWANNPSLGVNNVAVNLSGAATGNDATDVNGDYQIAVSSTAGDFTLRPEKNTGKDNGLTVGDALTIQQHLALLTFISDPYRQIAADVNKSNSISTLDALLLNQVLLGSPSANNVFNTSWRFVPASYPLPLPPWGFPEQIDLQGATGHQSGKDFYGVKLGDVSAAYADPSGFMNNAALIWRVKDQILEAGAEVPVVFSADQLDDLAAFQFALRFDPDRLQLIDIQPMGILPLSVDNFSTFNLAEGEIRSVWSQPNGVVLPDGVGVFRLRFTALKSGGKLSEALRLDDVVLPGRAYNSAVAEADVQLAFFETTGAGHTAQPPSFRLQITPNPFVEAPVISFALPQETDAELRIMDATGRLLFGQKKHYAAGNHEEFLRPGDIAISGVLYCELITPFGMRRQKMIRVE